MATLTLYFQHSEHTKEDASKHKKKNLQLQSTDTPLVTITCSFDHTKQKNGMVDERNVKQLFKTCMLQESAVEKSNKQQRLEGVLTLCPRPLPRPESQTN